MSLNLCDVMNSNVIKQTAILAANVSDIKSPVLHQTSVQVCYL